MANACHPHAAAPTDNAPERCPLCGGPNDCQLCTTAAYKGPCWCAAARIPGELLARVPAAARNRACICRHCVEAFHREPARAEARPALPLSTRDRMKTPASKAVGRVTPCAPAGEPRSAAGRGLPALPVLVLAFWAMTSPAVTFNENFATNPAANGWQIFGDPNLFQWDRTNQNLRVTWDSSKPNSYFHRPLGTILARDDDFSLSFDLTFDDYLIGTTPGKSGTFETAIGFLNFEQATGTNFFRGAGVNATYGPKNLVEFNFFPAFDTFSPTIDQVIVSTNNTWLYNNNLLEMAPGETFQVAMNYVAATRTLTTSLSNNAMPYGQTQTILVPANFDFRVTALSISSYSDAGQSPLYAGSILGHGTVDNLVVVTPAPPVENLSGGFVGANWQAQFTSRTNWLYTLERTGNLLTWTTATAPTPGNGAVLTLSETNPPAGQAFYRVRASRP